MQISDATKKGLRQIRSLIWSDYEILARLFLWSPPFEPITREKLLESLRESPGGGGQPEAFDVAIARLQAAGILRPGPEFVLELDTSRWVCDKTYYASIGF